MVRCSAYAIDDAMGSRICLYSTEQSRLCCNDTNKFLPSMFSEIVWKHLCNCISIRLIYEVIGFLSQKQWNTEVNVRTRMGFSSSLLPCSLQQHFTLNLIPRCCPSSVACQVARRLQPSLLCRRHPSSSMTWLVVACVSRYVPTWAPSPAVADVPLCSPIALD